MVVLMGKKTIRGRRQGGIRRPMRVGRIVFEAFLPQIDQEHDVHICCGEDRIERTLERIGPAVDYVL